MALRLFLCKGIIGPIIVVVLACVAQAGGRSSGVLTEQGYRAAQAVLEYYGPGAAASKVYIGSEACLACHPTYEGWRRSLHATGVKILKNDQYSLKVKDGVVADYDSNGVDDFKQGLDFNKITSAFNAYKPNAPILSYDPAKGYQMKIGQVTFNVYATHGGTGMYKHRYLIKLPVTDRPNGLSAGTYYSPVQYNEATWQYVTYSPQYWYDSSNQPKIKGPMTSKEAAAVGKSWDKDCSGCHVTGMSLSKDSLGEYVAVAAPVVYADPEDPHYFDLNYGGTKNAWNIGCERCHGPGSQHVTGLGQPDKIINPAKLTAMQQNQICGSCHSRGTSKGQGIHEFPWDEARNVGYADDIGGDLYKYFVDKDGRWPDKSESRQHHQQFQNFMKSAKWEFEFHKVTCSECHDPHTSVPKYIRTKMTVDSQSGGKLEIPVKVADNSLCLACHAGFGPFAPLKREDIQDVTKNRPMIAAVVSAHTRHSYEPERKVGLSRCTECHMAKVAITAVGYDISTHTFQVIKPEQTLATQKDGGMPNSCAVRCHRPMAPLWGLSEDKSATNWTESSDQELALFLQVFYGPEGLWWKTKKP